MNQDYEAKFKVGDKIRLYGKETTIRGFYISYNDALNKYETIMLTDGRGDPFERSLDAIEYLDKNINQEGSLNDSDWKEQFKEWLTDNTQRISNPDLSNAYKGGAIEAGNYLGKNVIAPLLQNELKGDDLVSSDIKIASPVSTRPSSFTNSIEQEFIICSAILYDDGQSHTHQPKNVTTGIVICGRRHHNCIYTAATLLGDNYDKKLIGRVNQGFLTNYDRYVDRKEAFQIAKKARQLLKPELYDNDAVLVSEDLYSEDIFSANPNISSQTLTQIEQDKKQTL